jgi:hypothetical protein
MSFGRRHGVLTSTGVLIARINFGLAIMLKRKLASTTPTTAANGTHCSTMLLSCTSQPSGLLY